MDEEKASKKEELGLIFTQLLNAPELRSEVRGYLRHWLFRALHNSRLGPSLNQVDLNPVSPKLQTLNLLIGEYLLKQRHHFTLSVFSCEAPNVSCISPNIPEMLKLRPPEKSGSQIFSEEDLSDIFDTLGLPKDSVLISNLMGKYFEKNDQAFLTCLLRSLPDFFKFETNPDHSNKKEDCNDCGNIERMYQKEIFSLTEKFKTELEEKNEKIKELQLLLLAHNDSTEQNKRIEKLTSQLKQMEIQFKSFEAAKEREFMGLKQLNRSLENEMQELQGALEARKKYLRDEEFRVEREKLSLKRNKKKLMKHQKQLDEVSIALTEHFPDQSMLPALEIQLQMKEQEISELKSRCHSLQEENKMLKSLSTQQRERIDRLNDKVSSLVGELHLARERALRARQETSEGDSSPTDDVVKDARRRIRSLEEEFQAIEKQHKEYKSRSDSSPALRVSGVSQLDQQQVNSPFKILLAAKSPRMTMVEEIQSSLKALKHSIKAKPERSIQSNLKILDSSISSISSESTGIELKPKGQEEVKSGAKCAFPKGLGESISPIPTVDSEAKSPTKRQAISPIVNLTTQLPDEREKETPKLNVSFEAEPLGTSEDLKLTIPSSSSSSSSTGNILNVSRPDAAVTEERVEGLHGVGRVEGDGMVETSTSEDKSAAHVTGGDVEDDNFWDL